jgi:hypothetical protein
MNYFNTNKISISKKILVGIFCICIFSCNSSEKSNKISEAQIGKPYYVSLTITGKESYLGFYKPINKQYNATLINLEDSNYKIPVMVYYEEGDDNMMYQNEEEMSKKQGDQFNVRIKGTTFLNEIVAELKVMMPNEKELVGKSFNLHLEDTFIKVSSDNPRSSRPDYYEVEDSYNADLPIKFIEKKVE